MGTQAGSLGHKHTAIQRHPVSIKLCKGGGPDMGSQVDINSCTDACTHSKQGVGTQAGSLGHKHSNTQVHPTSHITIHRVVELT